MNRKKTILYFIPAMLWMGIIFYFSSQTADVSSLNNNFIVDILKMLGMDFGGPEGENFVNFLLRKAAHVTEYFILFLLCSIGSLRARFRRPVLISAIVSLLYAMTDEFHQLFVPGRGGSIKDVAVDSIGIGIGLICILAAYRVRKSGPWSIKNIFGYTRGIK